MYSCFHLLERRMTETEALAIVRSALTTAVPHRSAELAQATPELSFNDLNLDSIATLETIGLVEDALGEIEFSEQQLGTIRTVKHLINLVMEHPL